MTESQRKEKLKARHMRLVAELRMAEIRVEQYPTNQRFANGHILSKQRLTRFEDKFKLK